MTKHFCDVCGKELSALDQVNAYNITITSKNRTLHALWAKGCPEVCEDCAKGIANIIDALKEKANG